MLWSSCQLKKKEKKAIHKKAENKIKNVPKIVCACLDFKKANIFGLVSEEFIVLLVGVKSEEEALLVANKIGKRVRENEIDVYAGNKLRKTISSGLSMFPDDSRSLDSVIKNADIALYEAKNSGRDKVVRFHEDQVTSVDLF